MIDDFVSQFHPGKAINSTFKCLQGEKKMFTRTSGTSSFILIRYIRSSTCTLVYQQWWF